ncbi:uncharacterized protein LOC129216732 [Uloborus diversus]|uniref:uncharacterized protein LOC129216732 n=1 Tax=Uloborus diversus TaxID=327109 RepID=UPI00240A9696|nr:uncharacterized protein LOC129216732 [Uloborus diversus]
MAFHSQDLVDGRIARSSTLKEFIERLNEDEIQRYVSSITYDIETQQIFIQLSQKYLKTADDLEATRTANAGIRAASSRLSSLSKQFKETYPILLRAFQKWSPCRQKLIMISKSGATSLERNSKWLSSLRLVCSFVDLAGTLAEVVLRNGQSPWSDFASTTASSFGFLGILSTMVEMGISRRIHSRLTKAVRADQKHFEPVKEWFEQTSALESAVKDFFPYGIDKNLVKKIESSMSSIDKNVKICLTAVISKAQKDIRLVKDEKLWQNADLFSRSEAAELWWNKVIMEDQPMFRESLISFLEEDIRQTRMYLSTTTQYYRLLEARNFIRISTRAKVLLIIGNMISAAMHLFDDDLSEISEAFRELGQGTEKELRAIESVVEQLKPPLK